MLRLPRCLCCLSLAASQHTSNPHCKSGRVGTPCKPQIRDPSVTKPETYMHSCLLLFCTYRTYPPSRIRRALWKGSCGLMSRKPSTPQGINQYFIRSFVKSGLHSSSRAHWALWVYFRNENQFKRCTPGLKALQAGLTVASIEVHRKLQGYLFGGRSKDIFHYTRNPNPPPFFLSLSYSAKGALEVWFPKAPCAHIVGT